MYQILTSVKDLCLKDLIEIVTMDTLLPACVEKSSNLRHSISIIAVQIKELFLEVLSISACFHLFRPLEIFWFPLFHEFEVTLFGKVNYDNGFILMVLIFQKESSITFIIKVLYCKNDR